MNKKEEIIKELASKYRVSMMEMRRLLDFPFKVTSDIIKSGSNDKILYNGFGKFSIKPYRLIKLNGQENKSIT